MFYFKTNLWFFIIDRGEYSGWKIEVGAPKKSENKPCQNCAQELEYNLSYAIAFSVHHNISEKVGGQNANNHSPASIEVVWTTKWWPNDVYLFRLVA